MRFCPEESFIPEKCTGCGTCFHVCPTGAVTISGGSLPDFEDSVCIGCGHCGVYCPENAFGLKPLEHEGIPGPEGFRRLLENRRSVRCFSDRIPSEEEIRELLSILDQCPTGRNAQGLLVVTARGEGASNRFSGPVVRLARMLRRTGLLQLAGALTGMRRVFARLAGGEDLVFRDAPVVIFFFVPGRNPTGRTDGVIAATTVMYHAVSMGLGTFWNGVAERLYPLFPSWHLAGTSGMRLTAVLCAGYPGREPFGMFPGRDYRIRFEGTEKRGGGSSC